ncbi:DMT family transporter [Marivivens marinus]|uniref:DMT family transporter n=1 Tax=Marivivens marinus TaxID=3110173 RepID=UPI003B84AA52
MAPHVCAAFWMIGAIVSFTSMAVAGRAVSFELDTFEIMFYRSCVGIVIVFSVAGYAGTLGQVSRAKFGLHLIRNLAHFSGQNLWFYALTAIPLAQVFALEFTTPIWAILLAPLVLGERITRTGAMAAALGFIGILIVARPSPDALSWGLGAAALSAVGFGLTAVLTRRLTRTETITGILVYLTVLQAIFGAIAAGYDGDFMLPSPATTPWLFLIGCAGLLAHFCLTTALRLAPASFVMPIDFARLPLIAIIGMLVYAEPIDALVFVGAAVIFAANWINVRAAKG